MKITIFGGTGATGQEVIKQALERNYQVKVLVRNPAGIQPVRAGLEVLVGNALDLAQVAGAVSGSDAVISTLGFKRGDPVVSIYSESARNLVEAMQQTGVRRLVYCTSAGVEDHDPNEFWFYTYVFKPLFLKAGYADMQVAEACIRKAKLEWVFVRPALLLNGGRRGNFRVSPRFRPKGGLGISRADLAQFMLDQVEGNEWLYKTPTLTY